MPYIQEIGLILVLLTLFWQVRQQAHANRMLRSELITHTTVELDTLMTSASEYLGLPKSSEEISADCLKTCAAASALLQPTDKGLDADSTQLASIRMDINRCQARINQAIIHNI